MIWGSLNYYYKSHIIFFRKQVCTQFRFITIQFKFYFFISSITSSLKYPMSARQTMNQTSSIFQFFQIGTICSRNHHRPFLLDIRVLLILHHNVLLCERIFSLLFPHCIRLADNIKNMSHMVMYWGNIEKKAPTQIIKSLKYNYNTSSTFFFKWLNIVLNIANFDASNTWNLV